MKFRVYMILVVLLMICRIGVPKMYELLSISPTEPKYCLDALPYDPVQKAKYMNRARSTVKKVEVVSRRVPSNAPALKPKKRGSKLKVNMNNGQAIDFIRLPGIGQVLAERIIRYRNQLGGFVDKAQLLEVYGVDSTLVAQLTPMLVLDPANVQRIDIWGGSFKELIAHPYLDAGMTKAIIYARRKKDVQALESLIRDASDVSSFLSRYVDFQRTIFANVVKNNV